MPRLAVLAVSSALAIALALPVSAQVTAGVKPLATVATNWDGVSIDLMAVERKGTILTVKWAVRNTGAKQAKIDFALTGKAQTTYVLDEESGTKYYALTDKEKNTLASEHTYIGGDTWGIEDYLDPAATARYWVKYPAPPAAVKTINVFFSKTEPIEGVAITDK